MTFLESRAPSGHRLCQDLRCKEMYYNAPSDSAEARASGEMDPEDDPRVYWCQRTTRSLGPYGVVVDLESCDPTRSCYRA